MNFIHHPKCNSALNPAKGDEAAVAILPVQRGLLQGHEVVRSYWQPTAEDLAVLNAGGSVAVTFLGHTHPPMGVHAAKRASEIGSAIWLDELGSGSDAG